MRAIFRVRLGSGVIGRTNVETRAARGKIIIFFLPSRAGDLDDLAPAPAPPEGRQGPVGTAGASRPAFFGKKQDLKHKERVRS